MARFNQLRPALQNNFVFADQTYRRPDAKHIEAAQQLRVFTFFAKLESCALASEKLLGKETFRLTLNIKFELSTGYYYSLK